MTTPGDTLGVPCGAVGNIRIPSFSTTVRYSRVFVEVILISSKLINVERTSVLSFGVLEEEVED
jgi:hypothetical protein